MSVRIMSLVFENQELSSTEKLIMLALADHANDEGKSIYPSQDRVSRKTGLSRRTVNRTTKTLVDKGYLRKVGYKEERNNVLELEISIKHLFDIDVPEDHISQENSCDNDNTTDVPEDHIKHHSNHQLKENIVSGDDLEMKYIDYFCEVSKVEYPVRTSHLKDWYVQVAVWVDMGVTKKEIDNAMRVADENKMTVVRPESLTGFIVSERAKDKRSSEPASKNTEIYKIDDGTYQNAYGEVVGTWKQN
jgi:DNA-binding MarR family transcriptional regulator